VIEAEARDKGETEGEGQAKAYAEKLQSRFACSTNGRCASTASPWRRAPKVMSSAI
jgi:hypothetical protein